MKLAIAGTAEPIVAIRVLADTLVADHLPNSPSAVRSLARASTVGF